jgi:hypothetical protein
MCLLQHSSVRAKAGMAVWNRSIIMAPATAAESVATPDLAAIAGVFFFQLLSMMMMMMMMN